MKEQNNMNKQENLIVNKEDKDLFGFEDYERNKEYTYILENY